MKRHSFWMIIGCVLPLLLIFLAPVFGLGYNIPLLIFIVVVFSFHLMMPMYQHGEEHGQQNSETTKSKTHEHHH